ncbi:hypothetical protein CDAR_251271 [Caerostris darwini]|uniref:Uncharacterized protein n=1 Tax=Caerostris darwini TaxID=1538125 RepID=A0AAV4R602_9ARAC|nr:hypothetical protein CDAR_251271 [Caerostris darwini]
MAGINHLDHKIALYISTDQSTAWGWTVLYTLNRKQFVFEQYKNFLCYVGGVLVTVRPSPLKCCPHHLWSCAEEEDGVDAAFEAPYGIIRVDKAVFSLKLCYRFFETYISKDKFV